MRAYTLLVTALAILSVAVTALANTWPTASINLNANPVVTYSITTNTYRENATFINYTALMLQSIKYDIEHRIPLNQTQLSYLAFLQALANQPTSKPSIVNVTIVSTGAQPLGPYASYEVFLINATLSGPAPTLLFYEVPVYFVSPPPSLSGSFYLIALPGTRFAFGYAVFVESSSICEYSYHYDEFMYAFYPAPGPALFVTGSVWNYTCTNSVAYGTLSAVININGVNYTLVFEPYQGASMTYPPPPSTFVLNTTAYTGGIGTYDVPFTTPLGLSCLSDVMLVSTCISAGSFVPPPGYREVGSLYLSAFIYKAMPVILMYPTRPGLYAFPNSYAMPPGGTAPMNEYVVIYANVTGPSVVPRELFNVYVPYGTHIWMPINASPLLLSGTANYGYMALVGGGRFEDVRGFVWAVFDGIAAGYNTSEPGFVSAALGVYDDRDFWALTPVTLNITLTDEYGYPVGYGLVTFGPNYYAWLVIVLAISAAGSGIYVLVKRGRRGRGEVVIRL